MTYCDKDTAKEAVKKLSRYEIKPNRRIVVKLSVQFNRLYIGGVPKGKSKDDIFNAFSKEVDNLKGTGAQIFALSFSHLYVFDNFLCELKIANILLLEHGI